LHTGHNDISQTINDIDRRYNGRCHLGYNIWYENALKYLITFRWNGELIYVYNRNDLQQKLVFNHIKHTWPL
jgi:hypothetical protein